MAIPTVIFDHEGQEVYRFHGGEDRQPISLAEVPVHVRAAFVAVEDPRFYDHPGLDLFGIGRAVINNLLRALGVRDSDLQGASTITQQLARSRWLNQEQTWSRKLSEAVLALRLELTHDKDQILEMYLNQIYFGNGSYGVERAARRYFDKHVSQITLAEGALLAGLINGPTLYDPYTRPESAQERRDTVLDAMVRSGVITAAEAEEAKETEIAVADLPPTELLGNSFVDHVIDILTRSDLAAAYGIKPYDDAALARMGLRVYTSLDQSLQAIAEQAVRETMAAADTEYHLTDEEERPEAAVVMLQPSTGQVRAMVGGRERTGMREYNRAADAQRQPGSAFKPFVAYLPALEAGVSPATILDDAPASLTTDQTSVWPENFDFRYRGLVSVRYAVEHSLNPVAVRAMRRGGGPASGLGTAVRFGFQSLSDQDKQEALALGGLTGGVTPLEMASAYGALANQGNRVSPALILRIEDGAGKVLYVAKQAQDQVVSRASAFLMVDMLKGVIRRGTAYGFTQGFHGWPAAGKTGTTDDNLDAWFAGFTPDLVTVVWTGYDTPQPLKWTGAFVPVRMWQEIMTQAVTEPPKDWDSPPEVVSLAVCRRTGAIPDSLCPPSDVVTELFHRQHVPRDAGDLLVEARVIETEEGQQIWQPGCGPKPEPQLFVRRPDPYLRHPTAPDDPRYVPADAADELPETVCQSASGQGSWDEWLPDWLRRMLQKGSR